MAGVGRPGRPRLNECDSCYCDGITDKTTLTSALRDGLELCDNCISVLSDRAYNARRPKVRVLKARISELEGRLLKRGDITTLREVMQG